MTGLRPTFARRLALVAFATSVLLPGSALAQPAVEEPEPESTTEATSLPPMPRASVDPKEVEALEKRIDELEAKLETIAAEKETEGSSEPPPPVVVEVPVEADEDAPPTKDASDDDSPDQKPPNYADGFHFGSYGRVAVGTDARGRPGRDGDMVARGSRLDESTYLELELRREDYWENTGAYTRIVSTVAFAGPLFHETGQFDANLGIRNLYVEESGLGTDRLRIWAGSRMYRGDDIYLLDFWPLDNLNTVGGGLSYTFLDNLTLRLHTGINQPQTSFFYQTSPRPLPLGQLGEAQVAITSRQRFVSSARLSNIFGLGESGGIKPVLYGEVHYTSQGQRERDVRQFEDVPLETGVLVGAQVGMFTGKRSTHLNLVARYAGGLAAYGEWGTPTQLGPDRTTKGAKEFLVAASGNYEKGPFGLLIGSYWRLFRNASPGLDFADLGEGIVMARPTYWFGKGGGGLSVEGSYQAQRRGVLINEDTNPTPQFGQMGRIGVMPFLSPGGRGNYQRPHLRLIYLASIRDAGARRLYPRDDVFGLRPVDHYIGLNAEWWFGSTSYFRD